MRRRTSIFTIASSIAVVVPALASSAPTNAGAFDAPATFRVGAAVVDISPSRYVDLETQRVCLGGFGIGCSRPAIGEREPLYARAIVIESGGNKIAFATATNIGQFAAYKPTFDPIGSYDVRQAASLATGIPAEAITVTSDHSHTGPDVNGIWGGSDDAYLRAHATGIARALVLADEALEPAEIVVGAASYTPEPYDHIKNHWDGTGGPLDQKDRELRVLQARAADDGAVLATLINFSTHASMLDGDDLLASGDWAGTFGNRMADRFGGVGISMVGALGGMGPNYGDRNFEVFVGVVSDLTDAALAVATPITVGGVGVSRTFIREELTAPLLYAAYAPLAATNEANVLQTSIDRSVTPPWAAGPSMGTYVSTYRIGDVILGMAPGEAYPEILFDLERGVSAREHFLFSLADDQVGYLISPLEGVQTAAQNGAAYPLAGNDNFALSVSPTIGEHVACSILDGARTLGFFTSPEEGLCLALTAADGVGGPAENPGS